MSDGNGTPVTWRELNLVVDPIKEDVRAIGADVKLLLTRQASDAGGVVALGTALDHRRFWLGIAASFVTAAFSGALGALLYLAFS